MKQISLIGTKKVLQLSTNASLNFALNPPQNIKKITFGFQLFTQALIGDQRFNPAVSQSDCFRYVFTCDSSVVSQSASFFGFGTPINGDCHIRGNGSLIGISAASRQIVHSVDFTGSAHTGGIADIQITQNENTTNLWRSEICVIAVTDTGANSSLLEWRTGGSVAAGPGNNIALQAAVESPSTLNLGRSVNLQSSSNPITRVTGVQINWPFTLINFNLARAAVKYSF